MFTQTLILTGHTKHEMKRDGSIIMVFVAAGIHDHHYYSFVRPSTDTSHPKNPQHRNQI